MIGRLLLRPASNDPMVTMATEIEDPKTTKFVPLLFAFNFKPDALGASFGIDWDKGGEGQDILREHLRSGSVGRVRTAGCVFQGVFKDLGGFNTSRGFVALQTL